MIPTAGPAGKASTGSVQFNIPKLDSPTRRCTIIVARIGAAMGAGIGVSQKQETEWTFHCFESFRAGVK